MITMIAGVIQAHITDSITIGAMRPYTAQACNRSLCHEATLQHPLGHPMSALMHGQHEGFGKNTPTLAEHSEAVASQDKL